MTKRLSPVAVNALKEALCSIYWYKAELRSFLQNCLSEPAMLSGLNWDTYKRQIVSDLVDALCADQTRYLADLTRLCSEVTRMTNFAHLRSLEDGTKKADRAERAVKALSELLAPSQEQKKEDEAISRRQEAAAERIRRSEAVVKKMEQIRGNYMQAMQLASPQKRGFELERILYDIFELFDLDPKASFRLAGEQVDGGFCLEGTDYLFEGKWTKDPIGAADIDSLKGKLSRKLDNTLGLFLSVNGYSADAVRIQSQGRSTVLLMDGADLMAVLENRIDLTSLLVRKRRYAAQTGSVYLQVHEILVR